MAYMTGKTSALQTAIKAAVDLAVAELNSGLLTTREDLDAAVSERTGAFTAILFPQVDEDNAASPGYGGGRGDVGSSSSGPFTLEEAKALVLNFGKFKGMALGDVVRMTEAEVKAYTNGMQRAAGRDYVQWMSKQTDPKAKFSSERAKAVLADFDATSAALQTIAAP